MGFAATWFAGSWCDVCSHPSGYAFVVATDSTTLSAYVGTGAAAPVLAWTQALPEPINWPRCAVDGSGNIAALGQGGNTNQALFVQQGATAYFGAATVQRPCFLAFEDSGFVGYICHDSYSYVRWTLAGAEPDSVRNPFSGGSVLGIVDVQGRKPIWAQAQDLPNGSSGGYYSITRLGNVFQLPMQRGSVIVGQAIGAPYTAEEIIAEVGPTSLSTVISQQGFDPRVAAVTGVSGAFAICARTQGTPSGAAALMVGPPWPAFDGSISRSSGFGGALPYQEPVIDPKTGLFTSVWYRALLQTNVAANAAFQGSSSSDIGPGKGPSFGKIAPTGTAEIDALQATDLLTLTSTDTTIGYLSTTTSRTLDQRVVPQGPDQAVQSNDNGTLYGDGNLTRDKTTGQVVVTRVAVTGDGKDVFVGSDATGQGVISIEAGNSTFQQVGFGIHNYVATVSIPAYLYNEDDGSVQGTGIEQLTDEVAGQPLTYNKGQGSRMELPSSATTASGFHVYQYGGLGTGAKPGLTIGADRNDSGAGAASTLFGEQLNGTRWYLWQDHTGAMRYGPARPTENGSVSDTSGMKFGTGDVTHTGTLTANELIVGNSGADIKAVAATDGQVPIGKTSDGSVTLATLTAGANVTITNGPGSITIASTGGVDGWIEGIFRALGDGSTTTFDLPDVAESLLFASDNGSVVDPLTYALGSARDQIVFASAPTAGHVLQVNYELASA